VMQSDDAPTDSEREVQGVLRQKLTDAIAKIDALMKGEVEALRKRVRDRNVNVIF